MKQTILNLSVSEAAETLKILLQNKGFTLFADIDHQANAASVDLKMPASRALIFGSPVAGTKLMQKDIFMSLDLPLRLALVEKDDQTLFIHRTNDDYSSSYDLENHPVLEKIEDLFSTLISELS
jgi:beta-galactosidase